MGEDQGYFALNRMRNATDFFIYPGYTVAKSNGGDGMAVYLDLVVLLNFLVDFWLLMGANRMCRFPAKPCRAAMAAMIGAVYAGACMVWEFRFLGNLFWRTVVLGIVAIVAYGWNKSAVRRGILFVFLSMALGGIALGLGDGGFLALIAAAAGVSLMCLIGFQGRVCRQAFVDVKITCAGKTKSLTALQDTGNTLKDPMTGESVLVVGEEVAEDLLGLTEDALKRPIETMQNHPACGFRLIPYRAVGQPCGMLLAIRADEVIIGNQKSRTLVAFAPQDIGRQEGYQALAGGAL